MAKLALIDKNNNRKEKSRNGNLSNKSCEDEARRESYPVTTSSWLFPAAVGLGKNSQNNQKSTSSFRKYGIWSRSSIPGPQIDANLNKSGAAWCLKTREHSGGSGGELPQNLAGKLNNLNLNNLPSTNSSSNNGTMMQECCSSSAATNNGVLNAKMQCAKNTNCENSNNFLRCPTPREAKLPQQLLINNGNHVSAAGSKIQILNEK